MSLGSWLNYSSMDEVVLVDSTVGGGAVVATMEGLW